jgi:outer membrane protein assembly factor BamB
VIFGCKDGNIYAMTVDKGKEVWRFKTSGPVAEKFGIRGDIVYAGSWDNNVYALDARTGVLKWRFTAGNVISSIVIWRDTVYVGSTDDNLHALSAESGRKRSSKTITAARGATT